MAVTRHPTYTKIPMPFLKNLTLRRFFPIAVIFCLIIAIAIIKSQPKMAHEPSAGLVTPVHVIEVKAYALRPEIIGFGTVEPDILLTSKTEVAGKISYVHPQLRNGAILQKDTVVIRIDPEDYQLALEQAQSTVASHQAKVKEIELQKSNVQADLELVQEKLKLAQVELSRIESLVKKQSISKSSRDNQQASVLRLQQEVQNLSSQLKTLPQQLASAQAGLANAESQVIAQKLNIQRTEIKLPFNARISERAVEENQYIAKGALLFSAQTTDKILINAQFSLQHFRSLAQDFQSNTDLLKEAFLSGFSTDIFQQLGLTAKVRLTDNQSPYWSANVERISSQLDPVTRTLGLIISVDHPYQNIIPGTKPPLMQGMYTEILLQGNSKTFYVIPRDALHENEIYIVNKDLRLERRAIPNVQLQGRMALLTQGLQPGETLIVSDVFPAVNGMHVKAIHQPELQQSIASWAQAQ